MTKAEQVALGTTLAGVNQYKVFAAVMGNFDTAIKVATEDVEYFNGSALRQNAKYMESIKAKIQELKAELQKLIFDNNLLQNSFKAILSVLVNVVKFFNSVYGKVVLLETALALIAKTIFVRVIPFIKELTRTIQAEEIITGKAITTTEAFNLALKSLELQPAVIAITAILAVTIALTVAVYKLSKATEEHTKKLNEQKDAIKEAQSNIESYKDELKEINEKIEEINNNGLDIDKNSEENLKKLRLEREELERLIELEQLKEKKERDKARKEAEKVFKSSDNDIFGSRQRVDEVNMADIWLGGADKDSTYNRLVSGGYLDKGLADSFMSIGGTLNLSQQLQVATANMKYYGDEFERLSKIKEEYHGTGHWGEKEEKELNRVAESLQLATNEATYLDETLQNAIDSTDSSAEGWIQAKHATDEFHNALGESSEEVRNYIGLSDDLDDELGENEQEILNLKEQFNATDEEITRSQDLLEQLGIKENVFSKEVGMSSIELIRQADAWNMNELALYDYLTAMNRFDESMDNIQSNYKTLQTAIDEYNEMQGFSVDTTQALLRMSPDYLEMLDEVLSGHVTLKDAILEKVKAQALEAKQNIYNTAVERINELATKDNKEATEDQAESFRNSTDDIDAQTEALDENARATIKNAAAKAYRRGATEEEVTQILDDMTRQLEAVDSMVLAVGKDFSTAMGDNSKSTKDTNNELKEQNNLLKQQKQLLEEKKKQYESVVAYIKKKIQDEIKSIEAEKKAQVDAIKDQIEALKDLKEEELDRIQEQIDALKDQKDVEKEYWQSKIDALKEQNDELKDQLEYEELLENLAKAKSKRVRVYKDGKFTYTEDSNEVDKAQAKINEYERKKSYEEQLKVLENYKKQSENNYDEQIKALEQLKKDKEKNYEQQIKDLEKYQEQVEADYDARIQYFQDYLDKFTKQTDAYENETNRQLAIQLTGIDFEQQGWQTRLDNLSDFVAKYNALLGDIHTLDESELPTTATITTTTKKTDDNTIETPSVNKPNDSTLAKIGNYYSGNSYVVKNDEIGKSKYQDSKVGMSTAGENKPAQAVRPLSNSKPLNQIVVSVGKKASGDSYISDDGMYLVGDSPNQELVIGSKLNGNLMNLTQGSGVVNATSTRTLASMLNQLGFTNQGVNVSNNQNKSTNINIGNISLPNVQNGKDFVDYLQNFSLQMTQEAFA